MSIATEPVTVPNCAAWRTRCATLALQISFLLGRQLILGQEPPIYRRSTRAVRRPDPAICQASNLPPAPLPRIRISKCSGLAIHLLLVLGSNGVLNATGLTLSVRRAYPDFLHETSTSTTLPRSDAHFMDGIQQLMAIFSDEASTVFAMHTSLRFTRLSPRVLSGSHTAIRIVTPPRVTEEANVQVRGRRDRA